LAFPRVPESRNESDDATVDWWGGLLVTLGLAALAYGLTRASDLSWTDPAVSGPLVVGMLVLVAFIWFEARLASPMMPPGLFRSRTFSGANGMTRLAAKRRHRLSASCAMGALDRSHEPQRTREALTIASRFRSVSAGTGDAADRLVGDWITGFSL